MSHADADVRVALIGYGLGGAAFHAPLIACTPRMRLATIVTRNPERRSQAAREHPRANIVDSVQAIVGSRARSRCRRRDHQQRLACFTRDGGACSWFASRRRQAFRRAMQPNDAS